MEVVPNLHLPLHVYCTLYAHISRKPTSISSHLGLLPHIGSYPVVAPAESGPEEASRKHFSHLDHSLVAACAAVIERT